MKQAKLELTNEIILNDIKGFKARIQTARDRLAALPCGQFLSYKERKKYQAKRREFEGEIVHINNLIAIARSALKPFDCQT